MCRKIRCDEESTTARAGGAVLLLGAGVEPGFEYKGPFKPTIDDEIVDTKVNLQTKELIPDLNVRACQPI